MKIKESYKNYDPPINVKSTVKMLLKYVSDKYLNNLKTIILTSSKSINRRKRRKKFTKSKSTLGTYYKKTKNSKPYIVLYVDYILKQYGKAIKIPLLKNIIIGETLYHEIGHHIHLTLKPEYKDKERTADNWSKFFNRRLLIKRYFYLIPILYILIYIHKFYKYIKSHKKNE